MDATLQSESLLRRGAAYCHIMSTDWSPNESEQSPLLALMGPAYMWGTWLRTVLTLLTPYHALGYQSPPRVYSSAVRPDNRSLARIAGYVDAGLVRPVVDTTYVGLERAAEAFEHLEAGHARGKVLVRPTADEWWDESEPRFDRGGATSPNPVY
jgi:hypothetical protein